MTLIRRQPSMSEILAATSVYYRMPLDEITGGDRSQYSAVPRMVACYLARDLTTKSLPEIARDVGLTDHTTVMNAGRRIYDGVRKNRGTREAVEQITGLVDHIRDRSWRQLPSGAAVRCCEDGLYAAACVGRFLRGMG